MEAVWFQYCQTVDWIDFPLELAAIESADSNYERMNSNPTLDLRYRSCS